MGHGEREFSLDYLTDLAVNKDRAAIFKVSELFESMLDEEQKDERKAIKLLAADENLDWNEALRLGEHVV